MNILALVALAGLTGLFIATRSIVAVYAWVLILSASIILSIQTNQSPQITYTDVGANTAEELHATQPTVAPVPLGSNTESVITTVPAVAQKAVAKAKEAIITPTPQESAVVATPTPEPTPAAPPAPGERCQPAPGESICGVLSAN